MACPGIDYTFFAQARAITCFPLGPALHREKGATGLSETPPPFSILPLKIRRPRSIGPIPDYFNGPKLKPLLAHPGWHFFITGRSAERKRRLV